MRYLLFGLAGLLILFLASRLWSFYCHRRDSLQIAELKLLADSGKNIRSILERASEFDFVLNQLESKAPQQLNVKLDHEFSWDQVTSLNGDAILELSRIETGQIQLRKRSGGYFITLRIAESKIISTETSLP